MTIASPSEKAVHTTSPRELVPTKLSKRNWGKHVLKGSDSFGSEIVMQ